MAEAREDAPRRSRPKDRRETILYVAMELFRKKGFAKTGIDEIGAAAGISGPGVYRHFATKDAILQEAMDRVGARLWHAGDEIAGMSAEDGLRHLIGLHVAAALDAGPWMAVWQREQRSLPDRYRSSAIGQQRRHVDEWVRLLTQVRPELTDGAAARTAVYATLAVIHYAPSIYGVELPSDTLRQYLGDVAYVVLMAPVPS